MPTSTVRLSKCGTHSYPISPLLLSFHSPPIFSFLRLIVLISCSHPPSLTAFSPLPGCWFRCVFLPLIHCSRSSLSSVLSFHANNWQCWRPGLKWTCTLRLFLRLRLGSLCSLFIGWLVVGDDGCLGQWIATALVHFSPLPRSFGLVTNDLDIWPWICGLIVQLCLVLFPFLDPCN